MTSCCNFATLALRGLIILGDFNKANFSRELTKYKQHITCPTRDSNILDHSVPRAALALSDYCLVHLIPTNRQKLKSAKPALKTVKRWTNETEWVLQACFDCTDWSVLKLLPPISLYHHREAQNHSPEHSLSPFLASGMIFPPPSGMLDPCQTSSNN